MNWRPLSTGLALAATLVAATLPAGSAFARTLDMAFLPPEVETQDLCLPPPEEVLAKDLEVEPGQGNLTDLQRLAFLRADIRSLQNEDANRWFDFVQTLIDWRATLDVEFAGTEALLARIGLYIDAGRLEDLKQAGLIEQLRQSGTQFTNAQKMALAQYYLNGIGVDQDQDYARALILDAGYGGNVDALMSLARMELEGNPVPGWDAPLDLTVTLAFGGMLGQVNASVCDHAERIAREYLNGDVVTRNPEIAYAWHKFAADLGGARAAWRVVEYHLDADAARQDNRELLHYLQLAIDRGIAVDEGQAERIKAAGDVDELTLHQVLGFNFSADQGRNRPSISPYLRLSVNLAGDRASDGSPYISYLRELTRFETTPGFVFTALAEEVLVVKGRWAAEPEALTLLEQAARRLDPDGMQMLARMLVRWRDDPAQLSRAIELLTETVTRFGTMSAMQDLDALYRCQANEAPLLAEADHWAQNYLATLDETVNISPTDLLPLDQFKQPEVLAQLQTQALTGRPGSLANFIERLQLDPWATENARRLWAGRTSQSDKALEDFARLEFALATNPAERNLALELFRRVYLNNGVATALDLAVVLTDDNARNPEIAREIAELVTQAGNRGEGAAIRLKSQLMQRTRTRQSIFEEFRTVIEERGDFLALMFAIPFVDRVTADDYLDRAVALMSCGTKDADELGEAYALLQSPDLTYHWRVISLSFAEGNVLAKLGLTDRQLQSFDLGAAPTEREVFERALAEGDENARRTLFGLTGDPNLQSYDPAAAAGHLVAVLALGNPDDDAWALSVYRNAAEEVRALVAAQIDIGDLYRRAAQRGDPVAKLDLGLLLRATAKRASDLQASAEWLKQAAEGGSVTAMAEYGIMLTYGIGVPQDRRAALEWLEQAERGREPRAMDLARLLRLEKTP